MKLWVSVFRDEVHQRAFISAARTATGSIPNYQNINAKIRLILAFLKNQTYNSTQDRDINDNIDIQGLFTSNVAHNDDPALPRELPSLDLTDDYFSRCIPFSRGVYKFLDILVIKDISLSFNHPQVNHISLLINILIYILV
jgi:hypothetical protein